MEAVRIVVASPSDVPDERSVVERVVDELNRGVAADRDITLQVSRWETDAYPGFHVDGPQGLVDTVLRIQDSDCVIGVFWKRFGTQVKNGRSGTEHELSVAYESWRSSGRPQLMVYFCDRPYTPKSRDEVEQWGQVLDFRTSFSKQGLLWTYRTPEDFERLLRGHLTRWLRDARQLRGDRPSSSSFDSAPGILRRPEAPPAHVRVGRKRFVHAQISAPGLEFVLNSHPYRDPVDPTDSDVPTQPLTVGVYLFLPSSDVLLAPSLAPLTPLAAFCTPDDTKVVEHLCDTLGPSRFAKLRAAPSKMMSEDKREVIHALAEVANRSLLTSVVIPEFVLEPARRSPKMAYETMNHLFLMPLLEVHRRLGVREVRVTVMAEGKHRADGLEATKKAVKAALRGIPHVTTLAEAESSCALCGIARTVAWCVQRYYNDGDKQWLDLLEKSLA